MPTAPLLPVSCAVIRRGRHLLLVQRPLHKADALKWEFPGGKLEPGETPAQCVLREIEEELKVTITLRGYLTPVMRLLLDGTYVRLYPFLAVLMEGEVDLQEHLDSRWVTCEEAALLDLCEGDRPILALLQEAELEATDWFT